MIAILSGMPDVIGIDADGVLLDYHGAYVKAWELAWGEKLTEVDPQAYYAVDRWGARKLSSPIEMAHLRGFFQNTFWQSMSALPGALSACLDLKSAGYSLVCVSALKPKFEMDRLRNLRDLGFPIDRVIATDSDWNLNSGASPKARYVNELGAVAFVDDFAPFLRGVASQVHKALIVGHPNGSPNEGDDLDLANSCHIDLRSFATDWIASNRSAHKQLSVAF